MPILDSSPADDFMQLSRGEQTFLKAIYHHLKCDGINASDLRDVCSLVTVSDPDREALLTCATLMRLGPVIKSHGWL